MMNLQRDSKDNKFKVFIELVFRLICLGHDDNSANDDCEHFSVMKWKSHSHEEVIHAFWERGRLFAYE